MSSAVSFEERRKELEALIGEFLHDLWERGFSVRTDAGIAAPDQDAVVDGLARKLEERLETLGPRTSARMLSGIVIQVAAARLRAVVSLAAGLSATERSSLAALLRLSGQERSTLRTILGLPDEERRDLATALGLSTLECEVLAAFVGDQQPEPSHEAVSPNRRQPAGTA
jgi:hypothetical protein